MDKLSESYDVTKTISSKDKGTEIATQDNRVKDITMHDNKIYIK